MQTELDPAKDEAKCEKHGLSLALAELFDLEAALLAVDERNDYNEERFGALGPLGDRRHVMVFSVRDETRRDETTRFELSVFAKQIDAR